MFCDKCSNTIEVGDMFCESCGQPVRGKPMQIICNSCKQPADDGDVFCGFCGEKVQAADITATSRIESRCSQCGKSTETDEALCKDCVQKTAAPTQRTSAFVPPPSPQAVSSTIKSVASTARMSLIFLLDTSASTGTYIANLVNGLDHLKLEVCKDKAALDVLDIAVVQFNDGFSIAQDFTPIANFIPPRLTADGSASYSQPIREAVRMADAKTRYDSNSYKPWIVLIAGSPPSDDIFDVAAEIQILHSTNKLRFMALGADESTSTDLKKLTDVVFRMNNTNFTEFFEWISQSMSAIARCKPSEKPHLPNLEGNVYRDR